MDTFTVDSTSREELIDITHRVHESVKRSAITRGVCFIYTPHTTAAVTINENADPAVTKDILKGLAHLNLEHQQFSHREGNSPAHIKSSLIGCSAYVIIDNGSLKLGTWQGIYLCEFDGPRTRKVLVEMIG
jgi:secondary thiamine-phosphate synthase enzyme